MKTYPAGYLAQLQQQVNTLAVCWRVIRRDNVEILGTEHDSDIVISTGGYAGTYLARASITGSDIRSTSDMSVENLEVTGKVVPNIADTSDTSAIYSITDLNPADIEAGLLDNADVTVFMVDYEAPDDYQDVRRVGWIGSINRTAEGRYRTELRGLTQALSQGIVRTFGVACDAEVFDARCGVDPAPHTFTGSVTSIVSARREFTVTYSGGTPAAERLIGGKITFTSGLNDGYSKEVKLDTPNIRVFDIFPRDIEVGDTFTVLAGCRKRMIEDCRDTYNNILNFRGHGVFVPGDTAMLKVGKR